MSGQFLVTGCRKRRRQFEWVPLEEPNFFTYNST